MRPFRLALLFASLACSVPVGVYAQAQPEPIAPPETSATLYMADFSAQYPETNTAFDHAISAANALCAAAKQMGAQERVVIDLEPNKTYRIDRPINISDIDNLTIDGNHTSIVNTTFQSTFLIHAATNLTIHGLSIDYDPLPFTQGVITSFDSTSTRIVVKVDDGYPSDPGFASAVSGGTFNVMDRRTRAEKPGARDLSAQSVESLGDGSIAVNLAWSANDLGPGQLPIKVGDVVAVRAQGSVAVLEDDSFHTSLIDVNLYSSPWMGILENGGQGAMVLDHVNIVPGPHPQGATEDRLVSTCSDGSHFTTLVHGPTILNCNYACTSDDAINVHGFYFYIVRKVGARTYDVSPKFDMGLEAGDVIGTYDRATFQFLGQTKILTLVKKQTPGLAAAIAKVWSGKSPTSLPDTVYELQLQDELPLKFADSMTSLSRIGSGTVIRNSTFHYSGRVMVKSPNSVIEGNRFSYSPIAALFVGSDIGYWSESNFADNVVIRNNSFTHCELTAANFFPGNDEVGAINVSMTPPQNATGFQENTENKNVLIAGNTIDDSYLYGIFVSNGNHVEITNNIIGNTFIRGSAFDALQLYNVVLKSGILVGMSKFIDITDNIVRRGAVATQVFELDRCDLATVKASGNILNSVP